LRYSKGVTQPAVAVRRRAGKGRKRLKVKPAGSFGAIEVSNEYWERKIDDLSKLVTTIQQRLSDQDQRIEDHDKYCRALELKIETLIQRAEALDQSTVKKSEFSNELSKIAVENSKIYTELSRINETLVNFYTKQQVDQKLLELDKKKKDK
jgi:hypothetical protein